MITNSEVITVRVDKPSATIILNRPEQKNAITSEMVQKFQIALSDLHQEKGVRAVIITGAGDFFSSGTDLKELKNKSLEQNAMDIWHEDSIQFCEMVEQMLRFPKPIIAAVNGPIIGSSAAFMLASDIVLASESAYLQFPEAKLGLVAGHTAPLLTFRVGAGKAARWLLTSEKIEVNEAIAAGIFHELTTNDLIWARANELAKQIEQNASSSIQMTKQILNETIGEEMLTMLNIGGANVAAARTTDSAIEGINAFLEKRDPQW